MRLLWTPQRLTCFYCGGRSKRKHVGKVSSFECELCDATNYLDEVRKHILGRNTVRSWLTLRTEWRYHRPTCFGDRSLQFDPSTSSTLTSRAPQIIN